MADEPTGNPWEPLILIGGLLLGLLALLWARGGLNQVNTQGFFIQPPIPEGTTTPTTNNTSSTSVPQIPSY